MCGVQAKEGTIEEGSAAWDSLSVTDRTKRKRAAEEKNTKLRSPNFSVSRTRLSVRNIPLTMLEKTLKQLFIAAVSQSLICCSVLQQVIPLDLLQDGLAAADCLSHPTRTIHWDSR